MKRKVGIPDGRGKLRAGMSGDGDFPPLPDQDVGLTLRRPQTRVLELSKVGCLTSSGCCIVDPPVRRVLAHGFPYAVLYAVKADYVWVVGVMRLKRRPGYWKHRLTN